MREATSAAQRSADAAVKQLEVSERPWIQLDLALTSPLVFDNDGLRTDLRIITKNSGNSPAASALMVSQMHLNQGWADQEMFQMRDKLCNELKQSVTNPFSGAIEAVFPGTDPNPTFWRVSVPKSEVDDVTRKGDRVIPLILTCVIYRFTFNDTFHQTAYSSYVGTFDPRKQNAPVMSVKIEPDMTIKADHLYLSNILHTD